MSLIEPTVSLRSARMTPLSSGAAIEEFGEARHCHSPGCGSRLSRYNPSDTCSVHRGWRAEPQTRRRR